MPTKLQIVNMALMKLGQEPLPSDTGIDTNARAARMAKAQWPILRDELLRQHPWNFAVRRIILTENLLAFSERFDESVWVKTDAIIDQNVTRAPTGMKTAEGLIDTECTQTGVVSQSVTIPDDQNAYTFSVYLRQGTTAKTMIRLALTGGSQEVIESADLTWAPSPTVTNGKVTPAGNGWFRVSVTARNNATDNRTAAVSIKPASDAPCTNGGVYAWGAQLEIGTDANHYGKTEGITTKAFVPHWGYAHAMHLPDDFIRMVRKDDLGRSYRIEGRFLLSNSSTVKLEYIHRALNPCHWDGLFVSAMVARLAAELAKPLTNDVSLMNTMVQLYEHHLNEARWADSKEQQQPDETFEGHTWLEARIGGTSIL